MEIRWTNRISSDPRRRPVIFVSSTVYDKKDMLDHIRIQVQNMNYDVRMSYAGTIPADSMESAYKNCLDAVRDADFFIGIISPSYGSGIIRRTGTSITHEEMRLARELKLPRLMLVDERVKVLADFLNHLGFRGERGRAEFKSLIEQYFQTDANPFKSASRICDIRSVNLYDEMLLGEDAEAERPAEDRKGNWIQEFRTIDEFKRFISTQFSYFQVMESFEGLREASERIKGHLPVVNYKGGGK